MLTTLFKRQLLCDNDMMRFWIIVLLIFPFGTAHSQRVGLVLSGGGAKGIAHVGVLKALEENNRVGNIFNCTI